jgi:Zn-dependent M28 family amino/carboxypeptidase
LLLALLMLAPTAPQLAPQDAAVLIIGGALSDGIAYARLGDLTSTIGPRLSGSPAAEAATRWGAARFKEDGLAARLEPVKVPHWIRGEERGEILPAGQRVGHPLFLTALGGSVGTPDGGVTGEVIEARSLAEIAALGEKARGKIVFLNHSMSTAGGATGYGAFVDLRVRGPAEAGRVGAAAVVLRSLATASLRSPHTGVTVYDDAGPKIPAAAVSVEDAELIHQLLAHGPVRIHLALGCKTLPDADSANVVAEVRGRELPDEVVLLGAHLDSWDLATGAVDDGAGVVIVMEAGRLIAKLPQAPRRTVRVVLYMNEENGGRGGKGYAEAHRAELGLHVAAMEADSGAGRPLALSVRAGPGAVELFKPWLAPLETLGLGTIAEGGEGGADIHPLGEASVPFISVQQDSSHYFDLHHSAADTFDKVEPQALAASAAAFAWMAYAAAEMPKAPSRPPPAGERTRTAPVPPAKH